MGVTILSAVGFAILLSILLPKVYEAKEVIFVPSLETTPQTTSFTSSAGNNGFVRQTFIPVPDKDLAAPIMAMINSASIRQKVHEEFPKKSLGDLRRDVDVLLSSHYLIEITVRDRRPALAAQIASAFARKFNEFQRDASVQRLVHAQRAIQQQIENANAELARASTEKEQFLREHGLVSVDYDAQKVADQRAQFQTDLDSARLSLGQATRKLESTQVQLLAELGRYGANELVVSSAYLEDLRKSLGTAQVQLETKRAVLTDAHPDVIALRAQVDTTRKNMMREVERITKSQTQAAGSLAESLRRDLVSSLVDQAVTEARAEGLAKVVGEIEKNRAELPALIEKAKILDASVESARLFLQTLKQKLDEVVSQQSWDYQTAVVVDRASPPEKPVFPVLWLNVLIAGVAGTVVGVLYAFFMEYLADISRAQRLGISHRKNGLPVSTT